ncbi:MAG: DUF1585 domain-containing protein [Verrucomicrobiales bacterium]|nr:DUF1585 domain-containing protein [Verrucomicrobiales bacterium]MDB4467650.1 DUF1585 domain-containing protein [Verrucomicrobiales bacterium]MDF1785126.1 DUF1585 domain-containing protein [Verrucomicrobiales bacterium]
MASISKTVCNVFGIKRRLHKALLLERQGLFARMLTGRFLVYTTGRRMEVLDQPEITKIVDQLAEDGGGLRRLIHLIV